MVRYARQDPLKLEYQRLPRQEDGYNIDLFRRGGIAAVVNPTNSGTALPAGTYIVETVDTVVANRQVVFQTVVNVFTGAEFARFGDGNVWSEFVGRGGVTSFTAADFNIHDATDATKKVEFDVSGITSGNIRTLVVPDKSGTVAMLDDIAGGGSTEFSDSGFAVVDDVDPTKKAKFQISGIDTATTRTVTVPNKSGTMAMLDDIPSPEVLDSQFRLVDEVDGTKKVAFQLSGLATATTRVITVPDKNGTLAMLDDVPGPTATPEYDGLTISHLTNGIAFGTGVDSDVVVFKVNVTGVPTWSWDESSDAWRTSKPIVIGEGSGGDVTHSLGGTSLTSQIELHSEGGVGLGGLTIHRHSNNNDLGGHLLFLRSKGSHAAPLITADGDTLGASLAALFDGTDYELSSEIRHVVDGNPATDVAPGAIDFYTNAGSQAVTRRMRIRANGDVEIVGSVLKIAGSQVADLPKLASTTVGNGAALVGINDAGSYFTATDVEGALQYLGGAIAALDTAEVQKGGWDASAGTFPGGGVAQQGWKYHVTIAGTVDGVAFSVGDRLVAIADNASTTTYANNWFKLDYTDAVSSVAGKTGAVTLNADDIDDTSTTNKFTTAADISKLAAVRSMANRDVTISASGPSGGVDGDVWLQI